MSRLTWLPSVLLLAAIVLLVEQAVVAADTQLENSPLPESVSNTSNIDKVPVKAELPLHGRIDALIESAAIGPLAPRTSDADFLRRIFLDLTGTIPSPEQVRNFLVDPAAEKRTRIVDELLTSPEFARHMAVQFNVLILERRSEKNIKQQDWERYLYESVAASKPLDQLFRELVYPEPSEAEPHPATKFILNREAEPNAVTREFGRLAFGMDLQCAQCHNHPLIEDYLQADYYGLFAFLNRTTTFTDPKTKLVGLSEKAEGDAGFKSVFTGDGRENTFPRVPRGTSLFVEPRFAPGDEYKSKPEKDKGGVPKFSRREALARILSSSDQFQRNLANRLWLLMFGRGIVHPVDFHHTDNPPNNPALLRLLTDETKRCGFQIRPILREIALSRSYQRTSDEPQAETINFADIAARAVELGKHKVILATKIEALKKSLDEASNVFTEIYSQHEKLIAERSKLEKASVEAKKKLEPLISAKKSAESSLAKITDQSQSVSEAAEKTKAAVAKLPDDKVLAEAAEKLAQRAKQLADSVVAANKSLSEKTTLYDAAYAEFSKAEASIAAIIEKIGPADKLTKLELAQNQAANELTEAHFELSSLQWRMDLCQSIAEFAVLRDSDQAKAASTWISIVEKWTIAGQLAPLKPLSSEQLAFSVMHAAGNLTTQIAAVTDKLDKSPPEQLKNAAEQDKLRIRTQFIQLQLLDALGDPIRDFVTHYGGMPGEDFQATVNQALFFGNGTVVDSWLKPSGSNLSARLGKLDNSADLVDELYVAVLSRRPTDVERQDIAGILKDYPGERPQAISELMWAMLSSNEFRFNH